MGERTEKMGRHCLKILSQPCQVVSGGKLRDLTRKLKRGNKLWRL
jgi:hypothetical protein